MADKENAVLPLALVAASLLALLWCMRDRLREGPPANGV